MARICQARLLLPEPKIFFQDGTQVFLTTICGCQQFHASVESQPPLCAICCRWEPIHGLVTESPPATTHCYGSVWFEERLKAGAKISLRDKLFLKAAADAAAAGRIHKLRVAFLEKPKEVKPRPRIIIKSMPPRKTTALPPPPPSSPTHGSLPVPPSPATTVAAAPKKKRTKLVATPSRKRSPTARIADRSPPAVAIGDDFQRTQQRVEALKSLLHVFGPAVYEDDDEPLEIDEYEYVKLQKVEGRDDRLQEESTSARFSYSMEKGIIPL